MTGRLSRARRAPLGPAWAALLLLAGAGCSTAPPPAAYRTPPPEQAGFSAAGLAEVDALLDRFVERRAFPGGVIAIGRRDGVVHLRPFGRLGYDQGAPPVTAGTIYDLASLTKVAATTAMAMVLYDQGRLDLDRPVRSVFPAFAGPGKDGVTVRHLLTHSSGIEGHLPLYREIAGEDAYLERIQAMELAYEPGTKSVYSDFGIVLLAALLERVAGEPLEEFVARRVFAPLGMADTMFRPPPALYGRIAPTEDDPWRGRVVRGEVHDENAAAMGGIAGHAGLFGTAGDLARFAMAMLGGGALGEEADGRRIVSAETVALFTRRAGIPGSDRALGWDTRSAEGSSAGELFSASSYGHLGFTGTSLWIDPERGLFVVLLTNRVHPTRDNALIREARPAVHDAVVRALLDER